MQCPNTWRRDDAKGRESLGRSGRAIQRTQTAAGVIVKDGSISGTHNPVGRGSTVVMFATGLGATSPTLGTGQPGPVPAASTTFEPVVAINGVGARVLFSGVVPGIIGLNQVNFTIPANAPGRVGSFVERGRKRSVQPKLRDRCSVTVLWGETGKRLKNLQQCPSVPTGNWWL
jgi:hypothetical protein